MFIHEFFVLSYHHGAVETPSILGLIRGHCNTDALGIFRIAIHTFTS